MNRSIRVICDGGHVQVLTLCDVTQEYAENLAGLMDGTSPMYVYSPINTDSIIGKCGICRAKIKCDVGSFDDGLLVDIRATMKLIADDGRRELRENPPRGLRHPSLPPADRSKRELVSGAPIPEDESHRELKADGQQRDYIVLSPEERAKGFVRPVRRTYVHVGIDPIMHGSVIVKAGKGGCGTRTTMGQAIAETYARDPGFYGGTMCVGCGTHLPLNQFFWEGTTQQVGS